MNAIVQYTYQEKQNTDKENLIILGRSLLHIKKTIMNSVNTKSEFLKKEEVYTDTIYLVNDLISYIGKSHGNLGFEDWETIEHSLELINSNLDTIGGAIRNLKINLALAEELWDEHPTQKDVIKLENPDRKLSPQNQRYDALEGIVFSEIGFSSLQAQDRVLGKLQRVIQGNSANQSDIGRIQSDIDSLQHMYRNFDSRWDNREELLRDIITADFTKNADLAQRISMFIRVRSAEKRNYTATQEDSPMLERHLNNLREQHPIIINTLEYGNVAITHIKDMYYEGAKGEYYKVRTQDKNGVKKDILLRTDNAVVGDLSRKYLGEFDSQGKLVSTNNTFTILSIQSDKIQHKKVELTFGQKVGKTLSSIKNKVSGIFKTQQ